MASKSKEKAPERLETALEDLEKIVQELESPDVELEKSIELFEKGSQLSKFCYGKLEEAEKKVELLLKKNSDPQSADDFEARPFED